MKPPACRFCGKEEWNHLCRGAAKVAMKAVEAKPPKPKKKKGKRRAACARST